MSLTDSKVIHGPFNLTLYDSGGSTSVYSVSGLKKDSVEFNGTTNEYTEEQEDGTRRTGEQGRYLDVNITLGELDTSDLTTIEGTGSYDQVKLEFGQANSGSGLTIVVQPFDSVTADVNNMRTTIKVKGSVAIDGDWSDILSIS